MENQKPTSSKKTPEGPLFSEKMLAVKLWNGSQTVLALDPAKHGSDTGVVVGYYSGGIFHVIGDMTVGEALYGKD